METINSPYEQFLDMRIVEKREGFCKIGISYRKELTNPHGNYHGGTIASIVDTATVQGLRTIFPKGITSFWIETVVALGPLPKATIELS